MSTYLSLKLPSLKGMVPSFATRIPSMQRITSPFCNAFDATYIHYIHTYTFDINIITSALKSVPGDSLAVPTTNTPGNNSKDYL